MKIKIEKNVKLFSKGSRKKESAYPFDEMEVGHSFFIQKPKEKTLNEVQAHIVTRVNYYLKVNNGSKKFTTRRTHEGVRCWRIK